MTFLRFFLLTALLSAVVLRAVSASAAVGSDALVARGRYLVEGVGLCADCHSPRDEKGGFIAAQWLRGAMIGFTPAMPMPAWAPVAPPIAGLPSMTAEQAEHFLIEGRRPDGSQPRPPMPAYRLNAEDARAVVAYLKSLDAAPAASPATAAAAP